MRKHLLLALFLVAVASTAHADEPTPVPSRPKVAGNLLLHARSRDRQSGLEFVKDVEWQAAETAIIICDMWDNHYCQSAAQRVGVMAPRMNEVVTGARNQGVMIIHAPSGCMEEYAGTPQRLRMQQAPHVDAPFELTWCFLEPDREPEIGIKVDVSPCDDPVVGPAVKVFTRQHPGIDVIGYDGVTDSGQEVLNYCRAEGIKNVVLMGVHTNMCVLGRSFGIRQMVKLGMNVVLARDLTDCMYDPREPPYVSHARGTEIVIEHIERYWCPSIEGADLMHAIPGSAGPADGAAQTAASE
ncbi:MAG: isochorismatase family protein [Planctomycetaceae bacterium]|nr:isochorismatase family protein [Planctomycetaceae bacterium]